MIRRRAVWLGAAVLVTAAAGIGAGMASASGSDTADSWALSGGLPGQAVTSVAEAEQQAAAGARTADAQAGETLILLSRSLRETGVDVPPRGFSPGDFFLFEERLFDRTGTRAVGMDSGRCEVSLRTFTCEATALVNGKGKIRIAGSLFSNRDATFPVTGGTGVYQGVGGELTVFDLAGGASALVFHLVR